MDDVIGRGNVVTTIDSGGGEGRGGMLYASASKVTMSNSSFVAHMARLGGVIFLSDSQAVVTASFFSASDAREEGGALMLTDASAAVLRNSTFNNNTSPLGAALRVLSTASVARGSGLIGERDLTAPPTLLIESSSFMDNIASLGGGAISSSGLNTLKPPLTLVSSLFVRNNCTGPGGGLEVDQTALSITGGIIEANKATKGGGIRASASSSIVVRGSQLISNQASDFGGAASVDASTIQIASSTLDANVAEGADGGGGLHMQSATAVVSEGSMLSNGVAAKGGGLAAYSSMLTVNASTLYAGVSTEGGGVFAFGSTIDLDDVDLTANIAGSGGGGGAKLTSDSKLTLVRCRVSNNTCSYGFGGGIMLNRAHLKASNSTLTANVANVGGSIYVSERISTNEMPTFRNVTFEANIAVAPPAAPGALQTKAEGGAIYMYSAGTIDVKGSTFSLNQAALGGAIALVASTTLKLSSSQLHDNVASESGGVVSVTLATLHSFSNHYLNNTATTGGAVFLLSSQALLEDETMEDNRALSSGGAIMATSSTLNIAVKDGSGTVLRENTAAAMGGALAVFSQSVTSIVGAQLVRNQAASGGAVSLQESGLAVTSSLLDENKASVDGGGLFCESSNNVRVTETSVMRNTAPTGGGILARSSAPHLTRSNVSLNRAIVGGGVAVEGCISATFEDSSVERNNASTDETSSTVSQAAGLYCSSSHLTMRSTSLELNSAISSDPNHGIGAGLAAHACSAELTDVGFNRNVANQAGGVLWRGTWPLRLKGAGSFVSNKAKVNIYSSAILWGAETAAGGAGGGGLSFEGCTRFADDAGNELSMGATCSSRRRRTTSSDGDAREAGEEVDAKAEPSVALTHAASSMEELLLDSRLRRGRRLQGGLAVLLGISTAPDRLVWKAPWVDTLQATSGTFFPNLTLVHAYDVYNNTLPTAVGQVTAVIDGTNVKCDLCSTSATLVNGVATFSTLGLIALPGSTASLVFESSVASSSTPMTVSMALCQPGEYLDSVAKTCRDCQPGTFSNTIGATVCANCPAGTASAVAKTTQCSPCPSGTQAANPGSTECTVCDVGSHSSADGTSCELCELGKFQDTAGQSVCKNCADGSIAPGLGSQECQPCGPGSYSEPDHRSCASCSPGYFQDRAGQASCSLCALGTYTLDAGAVACQQCPPGSRGNSSRRSCIDCEPGTYSALFAVTECTPCPLGSHQTVAGQQGCNRCPATPATYTPSIGWDKKCITCHPGANCSYQQFFGVKKGWWSYRPLTVMDGGEILSTDGVDYPTQFSSKMRALIKYCKPLGRGSDARCTGGWESKCIEGHTGPLCSLCNPFWFRSQLTGECEPCYDFVRAQTSDEGSGEFDGTVEDDSEQASILGLDFQAVAYNATTHRIWIVTHINFGLTGYLVMTLIMIALYSITGDPLAAKERRQASMHPRRSITRLSTFVRRGSKTKQDSRLAPPAVEDDSFSSKTGHEQGRHVRESAQEAPPLDEDDDGRPNKRRSTGRATFGLGLGAGLGAAVGLHASPPPSPPTEEGPSLPNSFNKSRVSMRSFKLPMAKATRSKEAQASNREENLTARILKDIRALGVKQADDMRMGDIFARFLAQFREKFKILITHYQIALTFAFTIDMRLPWREVEAVNNIMRPLNFDFVESFKLQCLRPMNYFDGLFVTIFSSTCALVAIPITACGILAARELSFYLGRRKNTPKARRIREAFVHRTWNVFLLALFLAFPPITKRAIYTFRCEPMEPDPSYRNGYALYLTADLSIKCFQGQHAFWAVFSGLAACVYTLGIPIFMAVILYTNHRKLLLQTPHCIRRYGFLYSKYQDHAWYWELVEMARKTFFGCVVMFWATGTATQIVIAMFAAFGFLILHLKCEAYKDATDAGLQTLSMTAIFLTLWIGLLAKTDLLTELQSDTAMQVYFIFTLVVNCLPLIGFVTAVLVMIARAYLEALNQFKHRIAKTLEMRGYKRMHRLLIEGRGRASYSTRKADAISVALQAHIGKKANVVGSSWLTRAKSVKPKEDSLQDKYAAEAADRRRMLTRQRTAGGHDRQAAIRQRAVLAREGKPHIARDPQRSIYLIRIRISQESIVLRHWPIGKGFIVKLPPNGGSGVIAVEPGRPPYLFLKAWAISSDGRTGFVFVKYDVRDSGFKLERDDVVAYPEEANRLLLVWEQKKIHGGLKGVAGVASAATKAATLKSKLASVSEVGADERAPSTEGEPKGAPAAAREGAKADADAAAGGGVGGGLLAKLKAKGMMGAGSAPSAGTTTVTSDNSKMSKMDGERSELKETDELEPKPSMRSAPSLASATEAQSFAFRSPPALRPPATADDDAAVAVARAAPGEGSEQMRHQLQKMQAATDAASALIRPVGGDVLQSGLEATSAHGALASAEVARNEAIAAAKAAEEQMEAMRAEAEEARRARDDALAEVERTRLAQDATERKMAEVSYLAIGDKGIFDEELEGILLGGAAPAPSVARAVVERALSQRAMASGRRQGAAGSTPFRRSSSPPAVASSGSEHHHHRHDHDHRRRSRSPTADAAKRKKGGGGDSEDHQRDSRVRRRSRERASSSRPRSAATRKKEEDEEPPPLSDSSAPHPSEAGPARQASVASTASVEESFKRPTPPKHAPKAATAAVAAGKGEWRDWKAGMPAPRKAEWRNWQEKLGPPASAAAVEEAAAIKAKARLAAQKRAEAKALSALEALDELDAQQTAAKRSAPGGLVGGRGVSPPAGSPGEESRGQLPAAVTAMPPQERQQWEHGLKMRLWQQQQWETSAVQALMPCASTRPREEEEGGSRAHPRHSQAPNPPFSRPMSRQPGAPQPARHSEHRAASNQRTESRSHSATRQRRSHERSLSPDATYPKPSRGGRPGELPGGQERRRAGDAHVATVRDAAAHRGRGAGGHAYTSGSRGASSNGSRRPRSATPSRGHAGGSRDRADDGLAC